MTYRVEGLAEPVTFDAGVSLLLTGAAGATDEYLYDAVTPADGEYSVLITTNAGPNQAVSALRERGADVDQLGVIDCTGQEADVGEVSVRKLSSPGDLTGISLEFAKLVDRVDDGSAVRVGFGTVSTALMYTELQTMFRFLHVFTARIRSAGMFGAFVMDPGMHDEKAYNTIRAVFDCELDVDADGEPTLRGTGFTRE